MAYNTKLNTAVIALDSIVLPLSAEDLNAFYKKLHPLILFSDGLAVADSLDKFKVGLDYLISLHFSEKVKSFLHKSIQAYPNVFGYENGNQVYIYIFIYLLENVVCYYIVQFLFYLLLLWNSRPVAFQLLLLSQLSESPLTLPPGESNWSPNPPSAISHTHPL